MADVLEAAREIGQHDPAPAGVAGSVAAEAAAQASRASSTGDIIKARMPFMVKGAGYAMPGGNTPLSDPVQIMTKAQQATIDLRTETHRGYAAKSDVVKSFNPDFLNQFGYLKTALSMPSLGEQLQQVFAGIPGGSDAWNKSFTAGNLGLPGVVSGLVPFNLLAPSRLLYPVYTVFRNKLPRPQGMGASLIERAFTGISGSQTGGQGVLDISIPELVQSGGTLSATSWPLNLPGSGSQSEVQLNVPYRFFGLTESLSWLAQFAGQGFEDVSALANLILLQEMMLGEEYMMLAGTSTTLSAPTVVSATARTAGSGETAVSAPGGGNTLYIAVTAVNYYGETLAVTNCTASTLTGTTTGNVVDVVISPVAGAQTYNIYGVAATTGTTATTAAFLWVGTSGPNNATPNTGGTLTSSSPGGVKFTVQGAIPAAGPHPPVADAATGKGTRMEGIIPTLTGHSAAAGVYPTSPTVWQGGYVNQSVGTHLSYNAIYGALDGLWESGSNSPGAFRADPAEIVGDGGDIMRLSNDVISQGAATNYRLFLEQGDVQGMRVGGAVSEFQNPITRSVLKMVVHPWMTQGTAMLMTYQLPQTYSNVSTAWEMSCVTDYASIAWPVIDASFRYSIFLFGALVAHAPMYSGILQGLQVSDVTPYS
jgi:hypothetical protein